MAEYFQHNENGELECIGRGKFEPESMDIETMIKPIGGRSYSVLKGEATGEFNTKTRADIERAIFEKLVAKYLPEISTAVADVFRVKKSEIMDTIDADKMPRDFWPYFIDNLGDSKVPENSILEKLYTNQSKFVYLNKNMVMRELPMREQEI